MSLKDHTFRVVAHRGDSDHAPENTLAAFDAAVRKGADELECDVRVSVDGVPVIVHDENLRRTTGCDAPVAQRTYAQLQQLDAGSYRGTAFLNERIPSLEALLERYLAGIPLQIELKAEAAVALTVKALQQRALAGAFERVLLTSFDATYLVAAQTLDRRVATGLLYDASKGLTLSEIRALGARCALPHAADATPEYVQQAHSLGLSVRTWGAKTLALALQAQQAGADGTTFNDPGQLLGELRRRGRGLSLSLPPLASYSPGKMPPSD